ncbi:MFS transporter [Candidatus Microgenomates bacterium]|nr:MFS transporter [Candidatus Microgenomates bacterium]
MGRNTVIYYFYTFFRNFAFFAAVLVPFYTEWGGITLFQAQLLQSWFTFCVFALEVPTGAVADYFGRKYSLFIGAIAVGIGAIVYGLVPNFLIFILGEFIFALGIALMSGADNALIYDSLDSVKKRQESKKIFGQAYSFSMMGMLVSAPLGGFIAYRYGINYAMILTSVPYFFAAFLALFLVEPPRRKAMIEGTKYFQIVQSGIWFFAKHSKLRLMALDAIIIASTGYFVIWLYQPVLLKLNIPISLFGLIHGAFVFSEIVVAANFMRLEKMMKSSANYLKLGVVLTVLGFFIVGIFPSLWSVFLLIILAGGFGLTRFEYYSALMNKYINSAERATVLSTISMLRRFALFILNPIVGLLADRNLAMAFLSLGILSLTALLINHEQKKDLRIVGKA